MSCEHAETTTLLWLYGEADEGHAMHVAACAECAEVASLHADVVSTTTGHVPVERTPHRDGGVGASWGIALVGLLAAAVALFALVPADTAPTADTVASATPEFEWTPPLTDFNEELDSLDAELDALSDDLAAL